MTNEFDSPGNSDRIEWGDLLGHLLVITVHGYEASIATSLGERPAVRADVLDADTGRFYEDSLVFPRVLVSNLRPRIGRKVLARLEQGAAKPGQNAPWKLTNASGDVEAVSKANKAMAEFGGPEPEMAVTMTSTLPESEADRIQRIKSAFGGASEVPF